MDMHHVVEPVVLICLYNYSNFFTAIITTLQEALIDSLQVRGCLD